MRIAGGEADVDLVNLVEEWFFEVEPLRQGIRLDGPQRRDNTYVALSTTTDMADKMANAPTSRIKTGKRMR